MAEVAASIIAIASFGIQLTRTLYEFGSTTSAAKEQTNYIARHVSLYATVLELLCDRINDEGPLLSNKAYDLVEELGDQSYQLFYKIRDLLPGRGRDDLTFFEKIKWNFKNSKVEFLVGELDYLKSTVHLLVTVLFAGKKIKSYDKRRKKVSLERQQRERDDVSNQCLKAQNAILEHLNAADKLPTLEAEAQRSETATLEPKIPNEEIANKALQLVSRQNDVITKFQHSLIAVRDPSDRQAFVLDNSAHLLHDLLLEWTTVSLKPNERESLDSACQPPNLKQSNTSQSRDRKAQQEETDKPRKNTSNWTPHLDVRTRDQSPRTSNVPTRVSGGQIASAETRIIENHHTEAPSLPNGRRSSEPRNSDPGLNDRQRLQRTTSSTSQIARPHVDLPNKAADSKPDRESNRYADHREQKLPSRVGRESLESLRDPLLASSRGPPKPAMNNIPTTPVLVPAILRDRPIVAKGGKPELANGYEPIAPLPSPIQTDRPIRASRTPPKPTVEDATVSDEDDQMPLSGRYNNYLRVPSSTSPTKARVEREANNRKSKDKVVPAQRIYVGDSRPSSVASSGESRYGLERDETGTIVDPSEFGGPNDYRAAYIKADKKGERGWEPPVVDHAKINRILEEYRKETSRKDLHASPRTYTNVVQSDAGKRDWAELRDDLATVATSEDQYRERFVKDARRDGWKAYFETLDFDRILRPEHHRNKNDDS